MTVKIPLTFSSESASAEFNFIPLPRKLFSFTPKEIVLPLVVPTPAPADISPVAFSSTSILIIFWLGVDPSTTSDLTKPKRFLPLSLFIDLLCNIWLKASPSSTIKAFLITLSTVILLPKILKTSNTFFHNFYQH